MIKQLFSIGIALSLFSQMLWAQWTPVGDRIKTSWAEKIDDFAGDHITYRSVYLPEETAIDYFYSESDELEIN